MQTQFLSSGGFRGTCSRRSMFGLDSSIFCRGQIGIFAAVLDCTTWLNANNFSFGHSQHLLLLFDG
jgi:hypothetical protein